MTSHEKTTKIAEETKEAIGAGKKVKSEVKKSKKSEIDNKAALIEAPSIQKKKHRMATITIMKKPA